jgi:hypothetical protein
MQDEVDSAKSCWDLILVFWFPQDIRACLSFSTYHIHQFSPDITNRARLYSGILPLERFAFPMKNGYFLMPD